MKQSRTLLCAISLFCSGNFGMEKSPRNSEKIPTAEPQEWMAVTDLIYQIESESSYANPHAPARIGIAGQQLLNVSNKSLVLYAWTKSNACANATLLVTKSLQATKNNIHPLMAVSSFMLLQQAQQIFSAIRSLHEKIEDMR